MVPVWQFSRSPSEGLLSYPEESMQVIESLRPFAGLSRPRITAALSAMAPKDLQELVEVLQLDLGRPDIEVRVPVVSQMIWNAVGRGSRS